MKMRLALVSLKLSVGMELILTSLADELEGVADLRILAEKPYRHPRVKTIALTDARRYARMILDTLNPWLWLQLFILGLRERPERLYLVSSHSLNSAVILTNRAAARLQGRRIEILSHIHDPIPHSKARFAWAITLSQFLQVRLSDRVAVFGAQLKQMLIDQTGFAPERVVIYPHPVCREERTQSPQPASPKFVSLLGRLEAYKGIDDFLRCAQAFASIDPEVVFVLGGEGDLSPYQESIRMLPNLQVLNRRLSNEEMDAIFQQSYAALLPYRDGTQSGVIPFAYYNACPVIITRTGSLPELVDEGVTGFLVEPRQVEAMVEHLRALVSQPELRTRMGAASFAYYRDRLRWKAAIATLYGLPHS